MELRKLSKLISFSEGKQVSSIIPGNPPENLIYTGSGEEKPVKLELIKYNAESFTQSSYPDLLQTIQQIDIKCVNWIHINNLTNTKLIEDIGNFFKIHILTLEDILNVTQLPKLEETGNNLFFTLKYVRFSEDGFLNESHISIILGDHFLLSFADTDDDLFKSLKTRLESPKNKSRSKKTDFLFYLILDFLVDHYYPVYDELYNKLEIIENELMEMPLKNQINAIHLIKKDLTGIRKTLFPLEKAVSKIQKDEYDLIDDSNEIFFRDVYDHLIQLVNTSEANREFISSLIELNSSNMNNSLNQTMKILTIITTIFIPLTFIAGIYGMNFKNMPELRTKYGYFVTLGGMLVLGIIMMIIMKKKGFFNKN